MPPTGAASAVIQCLRTFQSSQGRLLVEGDQEPDGLPLACVFKDGRIGCIVREDNVVEVLSLATGNLIGCKRFDTEINDLGSKVTCVKECWFGNSCHLLVGMETGPGAGMLCVFNFFTSKVIEIIDLPHRVSSLEVVCTASGDSTPGWALCEQLRYFCGVVAVGTVTGHVYFLDLGLDEFVERTGRGLPAGLCMISPRTKDVAAKRQQAMSKGQHLCMLLDENSHHRSSFVYRKPDDSSIKKFLADDVSVTCLQYIPQTGKLAVGFSFGCYQLWKLYNPELEYSSRLELDLPPVTHFAHQEPENDPKNFCYLWVARSSLPSDIEQESVASVSLYQLSYKTKDWFDGYGTFYRDLLSVGLRFDLELSTDPFSPLSADMAWSRILGCYTMQDPYYEAPSKESEEESFEDSLHGPDLSLSVVIWEAQESGSSTNTRAYLALFDMNRWYHAQMPHSLRNLGSMDLCSYFAFYSLDQVIDTAAPDSLLAVHVGYDSLRKFINNAALAPEQHFYPSSLAFEAKCILETSFVSARFHGTQRQVLMSLQQQGPSCLLAPTEMFNLCVYAGLLPRSVQPQQQREALLSLCLDHNLISFIKTCITQWADGDFTPQGCTLKFLLDWAWAKVGQIKETIDKTCVPLYDWSGVTVDQRCLQTLHHCQQKLSHMPTIFQAFLAQSSPITDQGLQELNTRLNVIELVLQQLKVVLWFVHRGLLPEHDDADELTEGQYAYPVSSLLSAFNSRRMELKKLHSNVGETDLLMIDGLIQHMGSSLTDLWDFEGGNGLYPPPSLHALMNMYLLEDIPLTAKHCVVLYLLLDIVSTDDVLSQEQFSERIFLFGQAMSLSEGLVKLVQGFWLLDHKDFQSAEVELTQPTVDCDLGPWQRHRIVKAFLYQGESKLALRYLRSKPPTSHGPDDIKLQLTVLLANRLTARAWEFQRRFRDETNRKELLYHLFLGCQQTKTFVNLLELPLSEAEERHLEEYLQENGDAHSLETLVMYYLQRGRYIEGIRLNESLKHRAMRESNPRAREMAAARNALVEGYLNTLPAVQRRMVFERLPTVKEHSSLNRVVARPKPLSTVVSRTDQGRIVSQSTLIHAMMEKVQEISFVEEDMTQTQRTGPQDVRNSLFISTPTTPRAEDRHNLSQSVVYPRVETPQCYLPEQEGEEETTLYPWKQLTEVSMDTHGQSPIKGFVAKRRMSQYTSASALSLLKTPPVRRKPARQSTGPSSAQPTPQSILKVRRLVQRSPSPKIVQTSSSAERSSQEDSPRMLVGPKKLSFKDTQSPLTVTSAVGTTPKLLRFADSVKPASPSPTLPPSRVPSHRSTPSSPRSLRDRSPTPEKISPKFAPRVDHLSPQKSRAEGAEEDIQVDAEEEVTFNFSRSQIIVEGSEEEEAMVTDSDKLSDAEEGEDVDMSEEPEESEAEDVRREEPVDGTASLTSSMPQLPEMTVDSRQGATESFSHSFIKGRSPIRGQAMSGTSEHTVTSSLQGQISRVSSTVDQTRITHTHTINQSDSTREEVVHSTTISQTSVIQEESVSMIQQESDPVPKRDTPDRPPVAAQLRLSMSVLADESEVQMSPLRLQMTPTSADDSVVEPREKTVSDSIAEMKEVQETTPQKALPDLSLREPLTVDTTQSEHLSVTGQMSPSQISPRIQTRSASRQISEKETFVLHLSPASSQGQSSPRKSPHMSQSSPQKSPHMSQSSPQKSPHMSQSSPQASPTKSSSIPASPTSTVSAPGSPRSSTSLLSSPVSVTTRRSNTLSVSEAKLDRLDSLEGRVTRSRASRSVSPMEVILPTPTRSKKLSEVAVMEGPPTTPRRSKKLLEVSTKDSLSTSRTRSKKLSEVSVMEGSAEESDQMSEKDSLSTTRTRSKKLSEVSVMEGSAEESDQTSEKDLLSTTRTRSKKLSEVSAMEGSAEESDQTSEKDSLSTTRTRSKKLSEVSVMEGSAEESDQLSETDKHKVTSKKKPGRRSTTRSSTAPSTPTRQSSRLREKERQANTPPTSPTASPARGRSTPSRSPARSPGRSPGRPPKGSVQKVAVKNTNVKELAEETEMVVEPSFRFSEPVQLEREANNDPERPSTPIHSFIFSPPLTRSQMRRGSVDKMSDVSSEAGVIPPPPELHTPVVEKPEKVVKRRGRKKVYNVPHCSPTNSPLNLLSPFVRPAAAKADTSTDKVPPSQSLQKKFLRPRKKYGGRIW